MNDSNSDSDDNDHQLHDDDDDDDNTEVEVEAETAAAASERRRLMLLKLISILERKVTYPTRTIKKIDHLVDDFLENLEDDVWGMLCSNDADANSYQGLANYIDTEAEVEAIIRMFPNVLSTRQEITYGDDDDIVEARYFYYPIQLLSFIPVVARLAIEFGCFDDELSGGLLCHGTFPPDDANVLQNLMNGDSGDIIIEDRHRAVMDNKYLQIFTRLRQMGLFKKEDIQRHELLIELVCKDYHFEEKRLRFLVEWDPSALLQPSRYGNLPIFFVSTSILIFQLVFEYGIRYYPKKTGICLLFKKVDDCMTPFEMACSTYGCDRVRNTIIDTLRDCQRFCSEEDNNNTSGPYNIADALITAAIDETIHLDGVYFLLRREPDILHKLLSSKHTAAAKTTAMVASDDNNIDIDIDEGTSDRLTSATKINPRKRKRKDRQNNNNNDDDDDDDFI